MKKILAIATLLTVIASVSPALAVTYTGIPSGFTFTKNLSKGMTDQDVVYLKTILAAEGCVSGLSNTQYFGSQTLAGVKCFCNKYKEEISTAAGYTVGCTGYVGTGIRAKLNALLSGAETPTTSPTPTPTPTPTTTPSEGYMTVQLAPSPADATVYKGSSNVGVYGFDVTAYNSDITIQRVILEFNKRPWLYVNYISLYDGANAIKGVEATSSAFEEVTAGNDYRLYLTDLSVNVPKGTTKTLTVKVSVPSATVSPGAVPVQVYVPANGVRGVDTAGLQQYGPSSDLTYRTFTTASATTGALEVKLNSGSPSESAAIVSTTETTEDVTLAKVDLVAKYSDITVSSLKVALTDGITNDVATVLPLVKLYDGDTLLKSATGGASVTFSLTTNPIKIAKGATKTLTVKANVAKIASGYTTAGDYTAVTVTGNATNITAEDANYNTLTNSEISGTATGRNIYFYEKAPQLALVNTSITSVTGSGEGKKAANFSIQLSVTALGGDVYIRKYDSTTSSDSGLVAEKQEDSIGGNLVFAITSNATPTSNGNWLVESGQTRTFTVSGTIPDGGTAGMNGAYITKVRWNTDDGSSWTDWTWTSIPVIFKTDKVYVTSSS